MPSMQCAYKITKSEHAGFVVHTDFYLQNEATGGCAPPPGGWTDDEYDANGNFVATHPGM
jgi:hypothetical protein